MTLYAKALAQGVQGAEKTPCQGSPARRLSSQRSFRREDQASTEASFPEEADGTRHRSSVSASSAARFSRIALAHFALGCSISFSCARSMVSLSSSSLSSEVVLPL